MQPLNKGFDPVEIESLKQEIRRNEGHLYVLNEDEPQGEEFAHFFFIGQQKGKDVIYDAVLYTLRLEHSSQVYEMAEQRAIEQFPQYKPWEFELNAQGELMVPEQLDEEVEMFKAEIMMELEEEEAVKVREHVELDTTFEYGIGLEACLNVEEITPSLIDKFIRDFNQGSLKLDDTLYSFQSEDEDEL
ncbi:hypothetical protein SAMN05421823_101529 [Catalinimonas alkaloidigena]|uniref:Uncharacterized protein n=1 Tax=Catalinimonas alkaloidigena TaxID=1075417 RepID=A0A1G8Y015_9BACT|nr:hypothetical protein [Catalinimonas alkaloidigena]SDJ96112.1 hypothetical protein SAMN05421823_101529 [Catalinimonas alkaloidigena]